MKAIFCFIIFIISFSNCFAQSDSSHAIHIGSDFVIAPITQFMDDQKNEHNFGLGISFFVNFDNVLALKTGMLYHFKKYIVFDDKSFGGDITTEFRYINLPAVLNFTLIKTKTQTSYFSTGIVFGLPIYKNDGLKWNSVDYMNNPNFSFQFGMGHKTIMSKKQNIYMDFEPTIIWFALPIKYGKYGSGGVFNYYYEGTTSGNHSRVSLYISLIISCNLLNLSKHKI